MAKNTGRGFRRGAVKDRSQTFNPKTGDWTKRGPNGQFMNGKEDGEPFKGAAGRSDEGEGTAAWVVREQGLASPLCSSDRP